MCLYPHASPANLNSCQLWFSFKPDSITIVSSGLENLSYKSLHIVALVQTEKLAGVEIITFS